MSVSRGGQPCSKATLMLRESAKQGTNSTAWENRFRWQPLPRGNEVTGLFWIALLPALAVSLGMRYSL